MRYRSVDTLELVVEVRSALSASGFTLIAPAELGGDDATVMAVTLFLGDGRIEDFPTATIAEEHDGYFHVMRYSPRLTLEWIASFPAADVTLAQVYASGSLQRVVTGDRSTQRGAVAIPPPSTVRMTALQGRSSLRTGAA